MRRLSSGTSRGAAARQRGLRRRVVPGGPPARPWHLPRGQRQPEVRRCVRLPAPSGPCIRLLIKDGSSSPKGRLADFFLDTCYCVQLADAGRDVFFLTPENILPNQRWADYAGDGRTVRPFSGQFYVSLLEDLQVSVLVGEWLGFIQCDAD